MDVMDVNYDLRGSSRISKILAFPLQSLEQCSAHNRYLTFIERKKEGEIAREQSRQEDDAL